MRTALKPNCFMSTRSARICSTRHDPSGVGIEVVPVDAAEEHGRAVDEELATLDLDPAEPDPARRGVVQVAVGIEQRDLEPVASR